MAYSAAQVVRDALHAWAHGLLADLFEAATVEGGPVLAGEAPPLPTLGIDWGSTSVTGRVVDEIEEGCEELPQGVLRLWYEDVELGFVWRSSSPEQADLFAHEFVTRAALEAITSNPDGNRVLHFELEFAPGVVRGAKLYLDGSVVPVRPEDNATRSLYTFRVSGAVAYPVMRPAYELGTMSVVVIINGERYALADLEDSNA